jgi:tetratricopeptide (TPR) repeat protein
VARAIAEYQTAATVDPRFSRALAQAGYGYALYLDWEWDYEGVPRDSLFALGFAAADEALRRDSMSADAWRVRAMLNMLRSPNDFAGADEAFRRALALDPKHAGALHSYAAMQTRLGNDGAAVELLHRALASEPGRPISLFVLFEVHYRAGRFEESRAWLDSALTIDRGFYFGYALRGLNRLRLGDVQGAREDGQTSVRFSAGSTVPGSTVLALTEIHQGDSAGARLRLERLDRAIAARDGPSSQEALWLAMVEAALDDATQAMDRLESVTGKSAEFWFWLRLPEFDAIRALPRFERLFEETRPRQRAPARVASVS